MFGYVRPLKPELLVREMSRYQSVYCGICRQIGRTYGQLPRVALTYDLTLLGLLLLALSADDPGYDQSGCILNPVKKKPMVRGGDVLAFCAALTVLLAWYKAADNVADGKPVQGKSVQFAFGLAKRKAARQYPYMDRLIREKLLELSAIEKGPADLRAAGCFADLLGQVFIEGAMVVSADETLQKALGMLGSDLGRWIYLLDAIDDWSTDCNNGNWNPFGTMTAGQAYQKAAELLQETEASLDRTAALLPYQRDASLLANIFQAGLSSVREQVMAGVPLGKL